jgi:hypothetical protein
MHTDVQVSREHREVRSDLSLRHYYYSDEGGFSLS